MNGRELIAALKKKLGVRTNRDVADALGVTEMTLQNWQNSKKLTPALIAGKFVRLARTTVSGDDVMKKLMRGLKRQNGNTLAAELGISNAAVTAWNRRRSVTARQIAGLVMSARDAARLQTERTSVRPLVEYCPINPVKKGKFYEIFSDCEEEHSYLSGLKEELGEHSGVYIFFDSRGQAIYVGKARKQKLWKEINLAFNRDRDDLQKIKRVKHPKRQVKYQTSDEKFRQITSYSVKLQELAHYFSAYHVTDGMVNEVEALLVRSFANDLLNKRMERFGTHRPKNTKKRMKK